MKIWFQSVAAVGKDPFWAPYEKVLEKHVHSVVRHGTTLELHGVDVMSPALGWLRYAEYLNTAKVMENALQAEQEGYDAFVLNCMDDPGFHELRQILNIPVVNAGETSFYLACQLAPKFALLAHNPAALRRQTENVKGYGLGERLVPSGSFTASITEVAKAIGNPTKVLELVKGVAKKAGENGAAMLVPTCGILNMILAGNKVYEAEGIPILDPAGIAVKMAELLVDLKAMGMERSALGTYTRVSKKELSAIRKLYGVD